MSFQIMKLIANDWDDKVDVTSIGKSKYQKSLLICNHQAIYFFSFTFCNRPRIQKEKLHAFLKTRFCNSSNAPNKTHFRSEENIESLYMSARCQKLDDPKQLHL